MRRSPRKLVAMVAAAVLAAIVLWWLLQSAAKPTPRRSEPVVSVPTMVPATATKATAPAVETLAREATSRPTAAPTRELFWIAGRVVDSLGSPVAAARVKALPRPEGQRSQEWYGANTGEATSDAEGEFLVGLPFQGMAVVRGSKLGYRESPSVFAASGTKGIEVVVRTCGCVTGSVLDPTLQPLAGAQVEVLSLPPGRPAEEAHSASFNRHLIQTDSHGAFALPGLAAGRYALEGSHPEYAPARVAVDVPESGTVEAVMIVLCSGLSICGRVLDDTGAPVGGALVGVSPGSPSLMRLTLMEEAVQRATSADDGSFCVKGLLSGDYVVGATSPSYYGADGRARKDLPVAAGSENVELVLVRGVTLRGRVVTPTGQALAHALIDGGKDQSFSRVESKADGSFEMRGLPQGSIRVRAQLEFYSGDWVQLEVHRDPEPEPVDLVLQPATGVEVSGWVRDGSGNPLLGARVRCGDARRSDGGIGDNMMAISAADGAFTLRGLAPDQKMSLHAGLSGYAEAVDPVGIEVWAGDTEVILVLLPESSLSGRVLGPEGLPVVGCRMTARLASASEFQPAGYAATDAAGLYSMRGLSAGIFVLQCASGTYPQVTREGVELAAGQQLTGLDFELIAGGEVLGQVVNDRTGAGITGVEVFWRPEPQGARGDGGSTRTSEDGAFRIVGLEDRPYTIQVRLPAGFTDGGGGQAAFAVVRVGDQPVIRLTPSLTLRGRVLGEGGEPLEEPSISITYICGETDMGGARPATPGGHFEAGGVPPCLTEVSLRADGYMTTRVQVPGGAASGVIDVGDVIMRSGTSISGVVLDPDGQPLAGVSVWAARGEEAGSWLRREDDSRGDPSRADGTFTVTGVAPGLYELGAHQRGLGAAETSVEVGNAAITGIELRLRKGARVHGRVTAEDGSPRADMDVTPVLVQEDGRRKGMPGGAHTAADGTYEIVGLDAGRYELVAAPRRLVITLPRLEESLMRQVQVPAGGDATCDFIGSELCRLTGLVADWDAGAEAALGVASVVRISGDGGTFDLPISAAGRFELGGVYPGAYQFIIQGAPPLDVTVPTAREHHQVMTLPAGRISGHVLDAAGQPATTGRVTAIVAGPPETRRFVQVDSQGRFGFAHAVPGTYRLEWQAGDAAQATLTGIEVGDGAVVEGLTLRP